MNRPKDVTEWLQRLQAARQASAAEAPAEGSPEAQRPADQGPEDPMAVALSLLADGARTLWQAASGDAAAVASAKARLARFRADSAAAGLDPGPGVEALADEVQAVMQGGGVLAALQAAALEAASQAPPPAEGASAVRAGLAGLAEALGRFEARFAAGEQAAPDREGTGSEDEACETPED